MKARGLLSLGLILAAASAFGLDLTLSGQDKPEFIDPGITRQCGANYRPFAMRVTFQPRMSAVISATPPMEMVFTSDDADGPSMRIVSDKLLSHVKSTPNRFVTVVFTQLIGGKPCLIDGKPIRHWVQNVE